MYGNVDCLRPAGVCTTHMTFSEVVSQLQLNNGQTEIVRIAHRLGVQYTQHHIGVQLDCLKAKGVMVSLSV